MYKSIRAVLLLALIAAVSSQASGATWSYHPNLLHNPPYYENTGTLDVWGTINCVPQDPPLFHGFVQSCHTYYGSLPSWANDYATRLVQTGCGNTYYTKTVVARYVPDPPHWYFEPLADWVDAYVNPLEPIVLPSLGDPYTPQSEVYGWVYLDQWYADQRPLLSEYQIVNGMCDDLPGHRFSSTPFVFNPNAPPDQNPFDWTPLAAGTVVVNGATITIIPEPVSLSLLGLGGLALLRRR